MAPPYGSSADGELCVSALKQTSVSRSKAITPELSWKTERRNLRFFATASVVARMYVRKRESIVSSRPSSR